MAKIDAAIMLYGCPKELQEPQTLSYQGMILKHRIRITDDKGRRSRHPQSESPSKVSAGLRNGQRSGARMALLRAVASRQRSSGGDRQ
jgi:hypothetical protein